MKYSDNIQFIEELRKLPSTGTAKTAEQLKLEADALDKAVISIGKIKTDKIKDLSQALEEVSAALSISTGNGEALTKAFDNLGKTAYKTQSGILGVIGIQQKLHTVNDKIIKQVAKLELQFKGLNTQFGVGAAGAGKLADNYLGLAEAIGSDIEKTTKYAKVLKSFIPLQAFNLKAGEEEIEVLFKTADMLQKNLQVTDAATLGYLRYTGALNDLGETSMTAAKKVATLMAGTNDPESKSMFLKQIVEDIGTAGATARIQYGKVAGSLEAAVMKSRQLGISMADLATTGNKLLDIESSVGKELEYQLLTGNRLVDTSGESLTAKYREATITGDMSEQADIMQTIMQQEGDTLRNNLFARQQMADLLGMNEEVLAGMLEKQKFISKYGLGQEAFKLDASAFEAAVKDAGATDAELLDANFETRDTQKQAADSLLQIESNTLKALVGKTFDGKGSLAKIFTEGQKEILEKDESFTAAIKSTTTAFASVGPGLVELVGQASNLAKGYSEIEKALGPVAKMLPGVIGGAVGKLKGIASVTAEKIGYITGGELNIYGKDINTPGLPDTSNSNQAGGPVLAGKSYMVGEQGPEVFTPPQTGNITANHNLGSGIDYTRLANAMSRVNLIVTLPPNIYASSNMNNQPIVA